MSTMQLYLKPISLLSIRICLFVFIDCKCHVLMSDYIAAASLSMVLNYSCIASRNISRCFKRSKEKIRWLKYEPYMHVLFLMKGKNQRWCAIFHCIWVRFRIFLSFMKKCRFSNLVSCYHYRSLLGSFSLRKLKLLQI